MARYEHLRENVWNRRHAKEIKNELLELIKDNGRAVEKLEEFEQLCWYEGYRSGIDDLQV